MRRRLEYLLIAASLCVGISNAAAQTCGTDFYRWCAKIDATLADSVPHKTRVSTILRSWTARALFLGDKTAARAGREKRVYSVTGWVRHVDRTENDDDWHIEITSLEGSPPEACIIVEIPKVDQEGNQGNYGSARDDFNALLAAAGAHLDSHNDLDQPVRMRFIGAAFFDGAHHTHAGGSSNHGGCNASERALWEIHPVYFVKQP